ncbi:MAG: hypothetical protein DIU56_004015 [Pseudomonadota bacterium]|jgi:hypothetical protein|nr:MAG: hypothetical protein DIU56_08615 [Pseudomonadota bacterium]
MTPNPVLCDAIERRIVIELRYHAYSRLVEPYVYGVSRHGDELLRCYQIAGGSVSGERRGWKLLKVAEIVSFHQTETSFEPRVRQYNPEDKAMREIYCRIE